MSGAGIFLFAAVIWHLADKYLPDALAAYERRTIAIAEAGARR